MAIVNSFQTAEYGKFLQLNSSQFPAVSVTRIGYYDASSAFPGNTGSPTYSAVDIYPKYAVLSYIANPNDISVSLSAGDINVNLNDVEVLITTANTKLDAISARLDSQLGQSGFVFLTPGTTITGNFTTVQVVSALKINSVAATNSTVGTLTQYELPANFTFNGPITSISLLYGAAIVYKL